MHAHDINMSSTVQLLFDHEICYVERDPLLVFAFDIRLESAPRGQHLS